LLDVAWLRAYVASESKSEMLVDDKTEENGPAAASLGGYAFGVVSVVASLVALGLFGLFLLFGGFDLVRPSIPEAARLLINMLLSLLFFVQHSWMARRSFRQRAVRWVRPEYDKSAYALVSSLAVMPMLLLWQGPMTMVWSAEGPLRWAFRGLFVVGALLMGWAGWSMAGDDPVGWRSVRRRSIVRGPDEPELALTGPYQWVRHPQYLATLLMIWSCPELTIDRIEFDVLWTAWILLAAGWEEQNLVERYGEAYRAYRRRVGMLLPHRRGRGPRSGGPSPHADVGE
jgi:protein-S-isoprenylcysteine O-methyltransferase Ste14